MITRFASIALLALAALPAHADPQTWERRLQDGSSLQVDPTTRRPIVTGKEGVPRQLWDGVHRLEDGSTVTVRSGVIVPTLEMVEGQRPLPLPVEGTSPCLVLMRKACGLHDECRGRESCGHAQQLAQNERDEDAEYRASSLSGGGLMQTTRQCQEALADEEFFKACDLPQRGPVATPCERLVDRVCGKAGGCNGSQSCGPAQQLLKEEYRERAESEYPDALTATSGQCNQALRDQQFFTACEATP
jgi:hypothetical protein